MGVIVVVSNLLSNLRNNTIAPTAKATATPADQHIILQYWTIPRYHGIFNIDIIAIQYQYYFKILNEGHVEQNFIKGNNGTTPLIKLFIWDINFCRCKFT